MSIDIYKNSSFVDAPYGLKLQQVLTSTGSVSVPNHIKRVWAVVVGGGGAGAGTGSALSAPVSSGVGNGSIIIYSCPGHTFTPNMWVQVAGLVMTSGTSINVTSVITSVEPNLIRVGNTTVGYAAPTQRGVAVFVTQGGGGGAGGYAQGWTPVSDTVTIGAGGVGAITSTFTAGATGGVSQYGLVMAGGGGGGNALSGSSIGSPTLGGAAGGNTTPTGNAGGSISYTGAPAPASGAVSYSGGSSSAGGVSSCGSAGSGTITASAIAPAAPAGLIAGGGGSAYSYSSTRFGGNGGLGDFFPGGTGTSGSSGGGGGGGGGRMGAGQNADLANGGNGGLGGGGGGGGGDGGIPGSGGNGIVLLYY